MVKVWSIHYDIQGQKLKKRNFNYRTHIFYVVRLLEVETLFKFKIKVSSMLILT